MVTLFPGRVKKGSKMGHFWPLQKPPFRPELCAKMTYLHLFYFHQNHLNIFVKNLKKRKIQNMSLLYNFYRSNTILKGSRIVTKQVIFDHFLSPPKNQRNHVTFMKSIKNSIFFTFFHFFSIFFTFFEKKWKKLTKIDKNEKKLKKWHIITAYQNQWNKLCKKWKKWKKGTGFTFKISKIFKNEKTGHQKNDPKIIYPQKSWNSR